MKSTIALSPQARAHLKRTQGQRIGTDREKDGTKPIHRTTEGEALDKQRGLKFVMPDSKLNNTPELPKSAQKDAIKTA